MGISGLTTFMDDNLQLLSEHQLQNTKIVVDGNNLYHLLYYDYNVDFLHGGDYDKFAAKIREFFHVLSTCNILPYVVFDGSYEVDDRKLKTILQRNQQRLNSAYSISKGGHGKILPILAYETFRQVLVEIHVPFVVCDFEADYDIAVLANDLYCPVLSYDSDFYIFPLTAGFIPFDSVNFTPLKTDEDETDSEYLSCRIYFVEKLTKCFPNLGRDVLPLLATLMGNDYVEPGTFEAFYDKLFTPKENSSHFKIPKSRTKLLKYINWLENVESLAEAKDRIFTSGRTENREQIKEKFEKSMAAFTLIQENSSCSLIKYFENEDKLCEGENTEVWRVPMWMKERHRSGEVSMLFKNILLLGRIVLQCQVENFRQPSSYACAEKIRQVTYGLLTMEHAGVEGNPTGIQEYDREMKNIKKNLCQPVPCAFTLSQIPDCSVMARQDVLFQVIGLTPKDMSSIPGELKMLIGVAIYWVVNSRPKVTEDHLKALLICVIFLHLKSYMESSKSAPHVSKKGKSEACRSVVPPFIQEVIQTSDPKKIENFIQNLSKFCGKPEHNKRNPIDISIIHAFSQFQTCLLASIHLNQLLLCPVPTPNPALTFKGVFLYNLSKELQRKSNTDSYLAEMLVRNSPVHTLFEQFLTVIFRTIKFEEFQPKVRCEQKKAKKKKSGAGNSRKSIHTVADDSYLSEGDECGGDDMGTQALAACSLQNRFASLNT